MDDQSWAFCINSPSVAPWGWGWQASLYCERLKPQPFWQAYRAHTATSAWSLQWPRGGRWCHCGPGPAHQPGGFGVLVFSLRTNFWTLSPIEISCSTWKVSVESDHAQNVYADMYNIQFSLSQSIFICRINLSPLLARGMNEETIPSPPQRKSIWEHMQMEPCRGRTGQTMHGKMANSHEVRPASFPKGGNSTLPPSSIPPHPICPKSEGKGFMLLSFLESQYLHL